MVARAPTSPIPELDTSVRASLPRGPHSLTRAEVEESQRRRILSAMVAAVEDKGFARTSVADVVARAGVSRATFYGMFDDKDACFGAVYEWVAGIVAGMLADALERSAAVTSDPLERLDAVLSAYLVMMSSSPALARIFLVDVYAAGPAAIEQRHESLDLFVDVVARTFGDRPGPIGNRPEQRFAVEALVGAVSSMVTHLVGTGQADRLDTLKEPLMQLAHELAEPRKAKRRK